MSAAHTPGPWKVAETKAFAGEIMATTGSVVGLTVAKVTQFVPEHRATSDANARLIASAPELLEALQAWVAYDDFDEPDFQTPNPMVAYANAINRTRQLLAKIGGGA